MIALIIVNAVILGVLTYRETLPEGLVASLDAVDQTITYVFAVEILLQLAYCVRSGSCGFSDCCISFQ